jgi:hypothetical protein
MSVSTVLILAKILLSRVLLVLICIYMGMVAVVSTLLTVLIK